MNKDSLLIQTGELGKVSASARDDDCQITVNLVKALWLFMRIAVKQIVLYADLPCLLLLFFLPPFFFNCSKQLNFYELVYSLVPQQL